MLWSENKLLFDIQDHSYNLQWLNVETVAIYEAQGLPDLGWTSSSRVFCVTDKCLHLAERGGYLFTCCAQSNCTTRLARTSYKIEQIISNMGGSLFWGMYSIHFLSFLTFHFGIVFGINPAFSQEGSYWSKCTLSATSDIFHIFNNN